MPTDLEEEFGPYAAFFGKGELSYLKLLHLSPDATPVLERLLEIRGGESEMAILTELLGEADWRPHLVGCLGALLSERRREYVPSLWSALDRGSWVSPQLAVTLSYCDPSFLEEARRRLAASCHVTPPEDLDEVERHVLTGPGDSVSRSGKNAASLLTVVDIMLGASNDVDRGALEPVLAADFDDSPKVVRRWNEAVERHFADLGIPLKRPKPRMISGRGDGTGAAPERLGRYSLSGDVGMWALGNVYTGHDESLDRFATIRTVSSDFDEHGDFRRDFISVARRVAALDHPNVITIYDSGEVDGRCYVAMELLEGSDLRELVKPERPLPLGQSLRLMQQVCDGVGFAQARGLVHGNLRPGNIRIRPDDQAAVMDFGTEIKIPGLIGGGRTRAFYLSPEQILQGTVGPESDVFALGVVFYELLSGRKPFMGHMPLDIMRRIIQGERESLAVSAPGVPASVVRTVDRALAIEPSRRFPDAGALGQEVRRLRASLDPTS